MNQIPVPKLIQEILEYEQIGPQWWKSGCSAKGQFCVGLDLKIDTGLSLVEKLLQHAGIVVEISTLIKEENYLEITILEES